MIYRLCLIIDLYFFFAEAGRQICDGFYQKLAKTYSDHQNIRQIMEVPANKPITTIKCLLCGGAQKYPGPKYQNHLKIEHGVVFNTEYLIETSIHKIDHNGHLPNFIDSLFLYNKEEKARPMQSETDRWRRSYRPEIKSNMFTRQDLFLAIKDKYPNVLHETLRNHKKAVVAYLSAKFKISEENVGLKTFVEMFTGNIWVLNANYMDFMNTEITSKSFELFRPTTTKPDKKHDCKIKLEIKKETLDEIKIEPGLESTTKLDVTSVPIKIEVQDDFKPNIEEVMEVQRGMEIIDELVIPQVQEITVKDLTIVTEHPVPTPSPKSHKEIAKTKPCSDNSRLEKEAEMKREKEFKIPKYKIPRRKAEKELKIDRKKSEQDWPSIVTEETQRLRSSEKNKIYFHCPKKSIPFRDICAFLNKHFRSDIEIFVKDNFIRISYGRNSWLNEDLILYKSKKPFWPHNGEKLLLRDSNLVPEDLKFKYASLKNEIKETELVIHNVSSDLRYEDLVKVFPKLKDYSKFKPSRYQRLDTIELYFDNVKDALEAFHSGNDFLMENWEANVIFNRLKDLSRSQTRLKSPRRKSSGQDQRSRSRSERRK